MELHADGFVFRRNPSPIGGGWTVVSDNLESRTTIIKPGVTNNETELRGVLAAAMLAGERDTIVTDSQNTVRWVERGSCAARPDLTGFASNAKSLINMKGLILVWRPRDQNLAGKLNETRRPDEPSVPSAESH